MAVECKTMPPHKESAGRITPPKYPVVLVHGVVAHDREGIINFWGRIPRILEEGGVRIFLGNTDSWGVFESNAEILAETIDKILLETQSEKVNIIAHSKGGLDSRYLIWKHEFGGKVASLTTVSTPHHGAELADLIFKKKIVHSKIGKKALEVFGKLYGDINPDLYNVNYQLTTENMKEFNKIVLMDDRVYYQSIYSTMKSPFDDLMFFSSYLFLKRSIGGNDGVVSEYSANWGPNRVKIEGRISHAEIIDYKMRKISGINIPDIYKKVINDLNRKGF